MDTIQQWSISSFYPAVKHYCEENNLEPKAVLLMDNSSSRPDNLESLWTSLPFKVVFSPPNTTSLLQLMDQGVMANFKAYYLHRTFGHLVEATVDPNKQSIRDF